MNLIRPKLESFQVQRIGARSILVRNGQIVLWNPPNLISYDVDSLSSTVNGFASGDVEYSSTLSGNLVSSIPLGSYCLWLKQEWDISKYLTLLPVNGIAEAPFAKVYSWRYSNPVFSYMFGQTTSQLTEIGASAVSSSRTITSRTFYQKIASVSITERSMSITENTNNLVIIPNFRLYYGEGSYD